MADHLSPSDDEPSPRLSVNSLSARHMKRESFAAQPNPRASRSTRLFIEPDTSSDSDLEPPRTPPNPPETPDPLDSPAARAMRRKGKKPANLNNDASSSNVNLPGSERSATSSEFNPGSGGGRVSTESHFNSQGRKIKTKRSISEFFTPSTQCLDPIPKVPQSFKNSGNKDLRTPTGYPTGLPLSSPFAEPSPTLHKSKYIHNLSSPDSPNFPSASTQQLVDPGSGFKPFVPSESPAQSKKKRDELESLFDDVWAGYNGDKWAEEEPHPIPKQRGLIGLPQLRKETTTDEDEDPVPVPAPLNVQRHPLTRRKKPYKKPPQINTDINPASKSQNSPTTQGQNKSASFSQKKLTSQSQTPTDTPTLQSSLQDEIKKENETKKESKSRGLLQKFSRSNLRSNAAAADQVPSDDRLNELTHNASSVVNWPLTPSQITPGEAPAAYGEEIESPVPELHANFGRREPRAEKLQFPRKRQQEKQKSSQEGPSESLVPAPLRPAPLRTSALQPAHLQPAPLRPAPLRPAPLRTTALQPDPLRPAPLNIKKARPSQTLQEHSESSSIQATPLSARFPSDKVSPIIETPYDQDQDDDLYRTSLEDKRSDRKLDLQTFLKNEEAKRTSQHSSLSTPKTRPRISDSSNPTVADTKALFERLTIAAMASKRVHPDTQDVTKAKSKSKSKGKKKAKTQKHEKDMYDEENVFSAESPMGDVDIVKYFQNPAAWEILSEEEKKNIRDLLPPHVELDNNGRPSFEFLKHNMDWRTATREFQEDLRAGRYEPEWKAQAEAASAERAQGKYDEWKNEQYEQFWGQKTKLSSHRFSAEMAKVSFEEMTKAGYFQIGDIWSYARAFGKGKKSFLVEKDVMITAVLEDGQVEFSVPSGHFKTDPPRRPLPEIPGQGSVAEVGSSSADPFAPSLADSHRQSVATWHTVDSSISDSTESADRAATMVETGPAGDNNASFGAQQDFPALEAEPLHGSPIKRGSRNRKRSMDSTRHNSPERGTPFARPVQVNALADLEQRILVEDGRVSNVNTVRGAETLWKSFYPRRTVRKGSVQVNQDLGSLYDERMRYWLGKNLEVRVPSADIAHLSHGPLRSTEEEDNTSRASWETEGSRAQDKRTSPSGETKDKRSGVILDEENIRRLQKEEARLVKKLGM